MQKVGTEYLVKKMKKSNWHGGKGSTPRTDTNSKQYQDNWEKIFGKPKPNINTRDKGVKNGKPKSI